ncbi:pyridoxal phosphate-dependent aminotransferase [Maribacter sp. 2210JD10-5]|uniref:pyridoxal phosphate-dependent aminotransferase n=1 Tax=Maribacter sp. 2210JD10-5 TaxID=3386272 RepID=UPI0039BCC69E
MGTTVNRRNWLKTAGLGITGLGLSAFEGLAYEKDLVASRELLEDSRIFLNANENPYGPSPMARKAMAESIEKSNRYGMKMISQLVSAVAEKNGVTDKNILFEAGSTKILDLILRYAGTEGGSFITPSNTFDFWMRPAEQFGFERISVPLTKDQKHDLPAMLAAIRPNTKLVYVCNPNNPTGTICKHEELLDFIEKASQKAMVLVDEAYIELTDEKSMATLISENKNVVVARTFSKLYGMAGARVGYAMAHEETLSKIKALQSWPHGGVSKVSVAGALAVLKDDTFLQDVIVKNAEARSFAISGMEKLGIKCIPSYTNFFYFSLANYEKDFFEQLEKNNILGTRMYEEDGKWSRITVGTMDEMKTLIRALA